MIDVICGLLFVAFCAGWVCVFQRDYISLVQHYYSGARNVSHGLAFPVIITSILTLLGVLLNHLVHIPIRFRALHWVPSVILLSGLSSLAVGRFALDGQSAGLLSHIIAFFFFLIAYYVAMTIRERRNENSSFFVLAWPNLMILCGSFAFLGVCSNSDSLLHDELRMERAVSEGRLDEALQFMEQHEESWQDEKRTARLMTALAAYGLSQNECLGERFFRYANKYGSDAFLPLPSDSLRPWNIVRQYRSLLGGFPATDMNATRYLEYLSRDTLATDKLPEFLLTATLLDRDLDGFALRLLRYYPPKDSIGLVYQPVDSIPLNFREALYLYCQQTEKPMVDLQDSVMAVCYAAFDSLNHAVEERPVVWDSLRTFYRGSYWLYYYAR